jgi:hypothetical protein
MERVVINRKEQTTAVDRMDVNCYESEPFLGRRDLFYNEQREGSDSVIAFVRHDFWLWKPWTFTGTVRSSFSAWSYKRAFANTLGQ